VRTGPLLGLVHPRQALHTCVPHRGGHHEAANWPHLGNPGW
jgi:hypothetical protein